MGLMCISQFKKVYINEPCTIINGELRGQTGVVVEYHYMDDIIVVKLNDGKCIEELPENIIQERGN